MKRILPLLLTSLFILAACNPVEPQPQPDDLPEFLDPSKPSQMKVFVGGIELAEDQTIIITEAEESLSGDMQMGITGNISGASAFRVSITRSVANTKDEFCAGMCKIGDGELHQDMDFSLTGGATETSWYAHFTPEAEGQTTISYNFQNYNKSLTLTVVYDYKSNQ